MKHYDYVLFDLDGTITDSYRGITNGVIYALKTLGAPTIPKSELGKFIGPPLRYSFSVFCGFDEEKTEEAVRLYREYYHDKGIFDSDVYPGIPELFAAIKKAGRKIILATSKPEEFSVKILEHFDLAKYFDFFAGATMDGTRDSKESVIAYALEIAQITDRTKAVMIGDRHHDINGAKAFGLDSIGVLYGFGSREEHEECGATYIAADTKKIADILGV